jgi:hypothetical protein
MMQVWKIGMLVPQRLALDADTMCGRRHVISSIATVFPIPDINDP